MLYCNLQQHELNQNELTLINKLDNQLKQGYRPNQDEYKCREELDYFVENYSSYIVDYNFEGTNNAVSKMILTLYCRYHPVGYGTCITCFKMLPNDTIFIISSYYSQQLCHKYTCRCRI